MSGARRASFPVGAALTVAELEQDPHALLARLRAHEPVSWVPALGGWLVTAHEHATRVMRDARTFTVDDRRFSTERVVGASMLTRDGAEHRRQRAPFAAALRRSAVRERFAGLVAGEVDRRVDELAAAGAAELRRELAGPLAVAVMGHVLGLADANPADLLGWYEEIVAEVSAITAGRAPSGAGARACAELAIAIAPALDGARADSPLAAAGRGEGALERERVISNAAVLLFGGIDTTEGAIANAVWLLLGDRARLVRARRSPQALAAAIEESLRLEPAAAVVDRYAAADVRLGAARIAAGELVRVSIAAANRDPATFADPDRFDVDRPNVGRHLAFAHGPHACVGVHLARLELQTAVGRLLERLPGLRLDPERPSAPRGLVFRKPPQLHVLWSPPGAPLGPAARSS